MSVKKACSTIFKGLDEDMLDYVVTMAEDEATAKEDLHESICGILMGAGYTDDETVAADLCAKLFAELKVDERSEESDAPPLPLPMLGGGMCYLTLKLNSSVFI